MKKEIAHWLLSIAKKLDPQTEFQFVDGYEAKKLGIGYHISKNDVKKYRKLHPEHDSHRKALKAFIEDTKKEVGTAIFAGIYKNDLINFQINKTDYVADVKGELYVYAREKQET